MIYKSKILWKMYERNTGDCKCRLHRLYNGSLIREEGELIVLILASQIKHDW